MTTKTEGMLGTSTPLDQIIYCPVCHTQHIDEPDAASGWTNPPHTSHLCHGCGIVFRLSDVPTNGVLNIKTRGSRDTWTPPSAIIIRRKASASTCPACGHARHRQGACFNIQSDGDCDCKAGDPL